MTRICLIVLLAVLGGCQALVDVERPQCVSDNTCLSLLGAGATCGVEGVCLAPQIGASAEGSLIGGIGGALPPLPDRYACVRAPRVEVVRDPSRRVVARFSVLDVLSVAVPAGLVGEACELIDPDCAAPVAAGVIPGADGYLQFDLPHAFDGTIRTEAPGYVTATAYDTSAFTMDLTSSSVMIKPEILQAVTGPSGMAADANLGVLLLEVLDCNGGAGDGIHIEDINDASPFYLDGVVPSRDLTATVLSDNLGGNGERRAAAGFQDLKAGYSTVRATWPETGELVSSITVRIIAGEITYVRLRANN